MILSVDYLKLFQWLTPDPRGIVKLIGKYAYKSSEKWKIKEETLTSITNHTKVIEDFN